MAILVKTTTGKEDKNRWGTQWGCFNDAQHLYGRKFSLDVCAEPATAKCDRFYAPISWLELYAGNIHLAGEGFVPELFNPNAKIIGFDSLCQEWENDWWCNPPFDNKFAFIDKAVEQVKKGRGGMMLLPYEPLATWWRKHISPYATAVYEPDGRYQFYEVDGVTKKTGANFGVAFVLFTPHKFNELVRIPFERGIAFRSELELQKRLAEERRLAEEQLELGIEQVA